MRNFDFKRYTPRPKKLLRASLSKLYCPRQSQKRQVTQWTNQKSKQMHVTCAKRGKTRTSKSAMVWVLLLIGRESGAISFNQSKSEVKQNQNKTRITLALNWKALYCPQFATCTSFEFWLVHCAVHVCCDWWKLLWLDQVITLVLVLRHSVKNRSKIT